MKYCICITFIFLLGISKTLYGQQAIRSLTVGDSLPDLVIPRIINPLKLNSNTSEYKDRLLILDFWSTNCISCIAGMPRMASLQKRFGEQIKILPVTYERSEKITPFWMNNKYTKNLFLPTIVDDKLFESLFPHHGVPHEVWIYKGEIIGITSADYVDAPNIQRILDGERVNWVVRYDFYKFDTTKPLFNLAESKNSKTVQKYVALGDYKPGVNYMGLSGGRGIQRDKSNKSIRAYSINEPVYVTYLLNWMGALEKKKLVKPTEGLDSNQVIWEVSDRAKYRFNNKYNPYLQEWIIKHGMCFELVYEDKGQSDSKIYYDAILSMDRLMGLHVRWEKRKEKVWVLKEISPSKSFKRNKGVIGVGKDVLEFVSMFNNQEDHCYVFNETKSSENLWMDLNFNPSLNLKAINAMISAYGLQMTVEEREVDKLIFTEVNGSLTASKIN